MHRPRLLDSRISKRYDPVPSLRIRDNHFGNWDLGKWSMLKFYMGALIQNVCKIGGNFFKIYVYQSDNLNSQILNLRVQMVCLCVCVCVFAGRPGPNKRENINLEFN